MTVSTILSRKAEQRNGPQIVTADARATVADAARLLATHNIGAVVVTTADGRVAGIFSERDLVRQIVRHGAGVLTSTIGDLMTRVVVTCTADDSIDGVMAMMTRGRFRHVPVIGPDGRLVGLVSIGDVVKSHVEDIEHEASALREYITHPPH